VAHTRSDQPRARHLIRLSARPARCRRRRRAPRAGRPEDEQPLSLGPTQVTRRVSAVAGGLLGELHA
jgi:hypothetical protein